MTALAGCIPDDRRSDPSRLVADMLAALRVGGQQSEAMWHATGACTVGFLESWRDPALERAFAPAFDRERRFYLWVAGEIFTVRTGDERLDDGDAVTTRTFSYRRALLEFILERGIEALTSIDGEYVVALWDGREHRLTIATDRFGSAPLFVGRGSAGVAFASGVRGVLAAPGIPADPDVDALREAVTFGGFRVGDRTNVIAVKRVPPAAVVDIEDGRFTIRRYRKWPTAAPDIRVDIRAAVEQGHELWKTAVRRRLIGASRPGQTLSGGLDSRAILAEASLRTPSWTALTYGIPGCDDARYAQRAAAAAGVTWVFHPLYSGSDPDWLDRRTAHIQETDGLVQLVDLMHLECVDRQRHLIDVHMSGYIGDAVCGPTFAHVSDASGVAAKMPFTGSPLGWSWAEAESWAQDAIARLDGAAPRFALFEHKLAQSTHPIFHALMPYMRVRRPFLDHALFDFFADLPADMRGPVYHRMLKMKYPRLFASIPVQSTGVPVLTPRWRVNAARAFRLGRKIGRRLAAPLGIAIPSRQRAYFDDERMWAEPAARARIESVVLAERARCCDIFDRSMVKRVLADWFDRGHGPSQVIGALYVFEVYHRDLVAMLQRARRTVEQPPCAMSAVGDLR